VVSACLRDKRLKSREESLSPFTRLTATLDWYTGSFSDRLLAPQPYSAPFIRSRLSPSKVTLGLSVLCN
jgi:hypothetical protein